MWLEITRPSNEIETQEQQLQMEGAKGRGRERQRATGNHNGNGNEGRENAAWTWSWHWKLCRERLCGCVSPAISIVVGGLGGSEVGVGVGVGVGGGRNLVVGSCFAHCIRTCNQHVPCMSWNVLSSWRILFSMQAVGLLRLQQLLLLLYCVQGENLISIGGAGACHKLNLDNELCTATIVAYVV